MVVRQKPNLVNSAVNVGGRLGRRLPRAAASTEPPWVLALAVCEGAKGGSRLSSNAVIVLVSLGVRYPNLERTRVFLNHLTHSKVASSTSSTLHYGTRDLIISILNSSFIVSAKVSWQLSANVPIDAQIPDHARRSE